MSFDLLLDETTKDVILKVLHDGYSWRFPAHSLLLANRSQTLKDMLEERAEDVKPITLSIMDMKPETTEALLRYIYTDECPTDVTVDLLIAASKYQLRTLLDRLEERLIADITVPEACRVWEELHRRQPLTADSHIKDVCLSMVQEHALTVFSSDLVMLLSKRTLLTLLCSDRLNVPDEAYLFWGVWRWGRRQCCMNDRSMVEADVVSYLDDLIVLIRVCGLRCRDCIPPSALARFDRCKGPRTRYSVPQDMVRQCSSFSPSIAYEDMVLPRTSGTLCLQMSFEKDVLLVGITLEICSKENGIESTIRLQREPDQEQVRRQKVAWCPVGSRKTSVGSEPETWFEAPVMVREPLFVQKGVIYSVYLNCYAPEGSTLPWGPFKAVDADATHFPHKRRLRVSPNNFVNFHGEGCTAVREVHVVPDVSVTWGPRRP